MNTDQIKDESTRDDCLERAGWYLDRIDSLIAYMRDRPRLDGDEVQQCQSMLREILARFRFDRRAPAPGRMVSLLEQTYLSSIIDANDTLRVSASSRPTIRWRDDLVECRTRISAYLDNMAVR